MDKSELSAADPGRRRLAAIVALVVGTATVVLAVVLAVTEFPRGLGLLACVVIAGAAAWFGALRRGTERVVGLAIAGLALVVAVVVVVTGGSLVASVLVIAGLLLSLAAARATLAVHVALPRAPRPQQPVLFYNTRSGGGKAERFAVAKEARARGIEPIELKPGDDLETLVRGAVDRGADALAMAGGDGSQAIVAAMAAERGLPYACIPAGTRNHFALDLGVDRDDVVGALDAFVDGGERTVDLAEVNGRVFVNNVSLGLYAEAVQHEGYRDAKLRTLLDTVPDVLGPERRRPRSALDRAGRARASLRSGDPRLQQRLPARQGGRLGHAAAARRRRPRRVGHRSVRRAQCGRRRGRRVWTTPVARMDGTDVRGRLGRARPGRHRWRSAEARPAPPLPHPTRRAAGPNRPRAPRRVALGPGTRRGMGRRGWADANRRGA